MSRPDIPFPQSPVVPTLLDESHVIRFQCHRGVKCWNACCYMVPEGCSIYSDRPTACRYYPVALLSMRKQDESVDRQAYALVEEPHCLGHREPREISIT